MKFFPLAPVMLVTLGVLTACGGSSKSPAPTPDTVAPVITLNGDSTVTHSVGTAYTDLGAAATDNIDSTVSVSVAGTVDSEVLNSYTLTYSATDAAGNVAASITRTVNVIDDIAPVLVMNGANPFALNIGDAYVETSVTASDNLDAASAIVITTVSEVNNAVMGSYTVTYTATDAAGNEATPVVRTVNVQDLTAPVITLNGAEIIEHNYGDTYTDLGATASDNIDASITVTTTGSVTTDLINSYTITYTATDASGNAATPVVRTVNVADIAAPVITLNGESTITIGQNRRYSELGATALDNVDGVVVVGAPTGAVDNTTIGQYSLTYSVTDAAGNTTTLGRTVDVVAPRPFITTWKTDNTGVSDDFTIKIGTDSSTHSGT